MINYVDRNIKATALIPLHHQVSTVFGQSRWIANDLPTWSLSKKVDNQTIVPILNPTSTFIIDSPGYIVTIHDNIQ